MKIVGATGSRFMGVRGGLERVLALWAIAGVRVGVVLR